MHECPECGQVCDCGDGDDTWLIDGDPWLTEAAEGLEHLWGLDDPAAKRLRALAAGPSAEVGRE